MGNKYEQNAEFELDLHGYNTFEAKEVLDATLLADEYDHIRIIIGKGNHSVDGPVLPDFVRAYLNGRNIRYRQAKLRDGGAGALEVFLN